MALHNEIDRCSEMVQNEAESPYQSLPVSDLSGSPHSDTIAASGNSLSKKWANALPQFDCSKTIRVIFYK